MKRDFFELLIQKYIYASSIMQSFESFMNFIYSVFLQQIHRVAKIKNAYYT